MAKLDIFFKLTNYLVVFLEKKIGIKNNFVTLSPNLES